MTANETFRKINKAGKYMPEVLLKALKDCRAIAVETGGCTQQITLRFNEEELLYLLYKVGKGGPI